MSPTGKVICGVAYSVAEGHQTHVEVQEISHEKQEASYFSFQKCVNTEFAIRHVA